MLLQEHAAGESRDPVDNCSMIASWPKWGERGFGRRLVCARCDFSRQTQSLLFAAARPDLIRWRLASN